MSTAAQRLGEFASKLAYTDIPAEVAERAKTCIIDTVAAATFGTQFPWSRMVVDYAQRYGSGGVCSIVGVPAARVHAPYAALANGVLAHSYELDSVGGSHTGATILPAVLAACEESNADGKTAITAFVAGCEVAFRLGEASFGSPEKRGFHGPGIMGAYAAAAAAGRVLGLGPEALAHALGIAGSLSAGLLAFSKAQNGAMVKRLHLGRASESGILAARLAHAGYTGPETVLDGKFGFLDAYCREGERDIKLLTEALHKKWWTMHIGIKRYACHVYAHTPVQTLRELMAEHAFQGADVAHVIVEGSDEHKLVSHHNIPEPADIMQAQYSVPFCIALALFMDPEDPRSFNESALNNAAIRTACRNVELRGAQGHTSRSARVIVRLKDGREIEGYRKFFKGMPQAPLSLTELRRKFMLLCSADDAQAALLFDQLSELELQPRFSLSRPQR